MTTAAPALGAEEVAFFRREGYLLPGRPLFDDGDFADLAATFERLQERWIAAGERPEQIGVPHFYDPSLMRWLLHDRVLDVVESLIGPDIALFASHFICKPPGDGQEVPWHEDSAYWGRMFDPMEVVTIWLALDPADPGNGNMRVIPRSHHHGYSDYVPQEGPAVFTTRIDPSQVDEARAVDCTLARGCYSIHHAKLIHGSRPNASDRRRCGYTMRYVPTTCRWQRDPTIDYQRHFQLYLARGVDRAGNTYADPTEPNHAWLAWKPLRGGPGHPGPSAVTTM